MKCECGNNLNIHNEDGICNICLTENKFVTVRFVGLEACWSLKDYEECRSYYEEGDLPIPKEYTFKMRAKRAVNIQRLLRDYKKGKDVDVNVLVNDLIETFLIDIMKVVNEDNSYSVGKMVEWMR